MMSACRCTDRTTCTRVSCTPCALPDAERAALGFPHVGQGAALKQALRALPPFPREALARLQALPSIKPGFVPPMRLADGRIGYRLSGRTAGGQRSSPRWKPCTVCAS